MGITSEENKFFIAYTVSHNVRNIHGNGVVTYRKKLPEIEIEDIVYIQKFIANQNGLKEGTVTLTNIVEMGVAE